MTARQKIFWLRLATLIGLCLPALELAWRWYTGGLEPRPVTAATHATGDWAVIFLMLSLAMTPARALFDWMPLVQIRRRIGVAAKRFKSLRARAMTTVNPNPHKPLPIRFIPIKPGTRKSTYRAPVSVILSSPTVKRSVLPFARCKTSSTTSLAVRLSGLVGSKRNE